MYVMGLLFWRANKGTGACGYYISTTECKYSIQSMGLNDAPKPPKHQTEDDNSLFVLRHDWLTLNAGHFYQTFNLPCKCPIFGMLLKLGENMLTFLGDSLYISSLSSSSHFIAHHTISTISISVTSLLFRLNVIDCHMFVSYLCILCM